MIDLIFEGQKSLLFQSDVRKIYSELFKRFSILEVRRFSFALNAIENVSKLYQSQIGVTFSTVLKQEKDGMRKTSIEMQNRRALSSKSQMMDLLKKHASYGAPGNIEQQILITCFFMHMPDILRNDVLSPLLIQLSQRQEFERNTHFQRIGRVIIQLHQ